MFLCFLQSFDNGIWDLKINTIFSEADLFISIKVSYLNFFLSAKLCSMEFDWLQWIELIFRNFFFIWTSWTISKYLKIARKANYFSNAWNSSLTLKGHWEVALKLNPSDCFLWRNNIILNDNKIINRVGKEKRIIIILINKFKTKQLMF